MRKMNLLIISDTFNLLLSGGNYHITPWDSDFKILFSNISSYHALVLDFTGIDNNRLLKIQDNLVYLETLLTPELVDQEKLITVVICGSMKEDFSITIYYDESPSPRDEIRKKYSYDFLSKIIPEYDTRVRFPINGVYFEKLSIKNIAVRQYVDIVDKYFLQFTYDPDSKVCANIYPIIKIKKDTPYCVAFENRIGRGLVMILPSYSIHNKEIAITCIIKICKNYFKVAEGYEDLELNIDIPMQIRENYSEALVCFLNDLYNSSCVLCSRALEALFNLIGAEGKLLIEKIQYLYEKGMLAKKTKNLADQIRYFRNEAAHYNSNINLLRKSDFHDLGYLILKLQAADDNLSQFIISQLSENTVSLLKKYDHSKIADEKLINPLITELNNIIKGELYSDELFKDIDLQEDTKLLIKEPPNEKNNLISLNLRLLSEAYPHALLIGSDTTIIEEDAERILLFFKQVLDEFQPFEKIQEELELIKRKEKSE